jgi:FkbM family methyltransferase
MKNKVLNEILNYIILKYLYKNRREYNFAIYNDWIGYNILLNGYYEKRELNRLVDSFSFDTFQCNVLDIGANIGNHSVFFSQYFKRVISFEPQKRTFELLKLNTSRLENVEVFNYGLSSTEGDVIFNIPYSNTGLANQNEFDSLMYQEKVTMKNLHNVISDIEFGLIKIDVEGSEIDVIVSISSFIKKSLPIISFELNKNSNHEIIDVLKKHGYNKFYILKENEYLFKITGNSIFHKSFRFLIRLFSNDRQSGLKIVQKFENREYPLVTAVHPLSHFKVK